jgi:hypothetical protein
MEISNEEKAQLLQSWIDNLDIHITNLIEGIKKYPDSDIDGKTPRSEVLNDFMYRKEFFKNALEALPKQF